MGRGGYDSGASRARTESRQSAPQQQVFTQSRAGRHHESMSVMGLNVREARDSDQHPRSVPILWEIDGTGSMGEIPNMLARQTFPDFMDLVLVVEPDPQVLFGVFLDYEDGSGPNSLQQGQFESSDELIDQWLTRMYFEGGGRPSEGSDLAYYFAARHTATDAWVKRRAKGFHFLVTDDTMRETVQTRHVRGLFGATARLSEDTPTITIVREAQELYHCFCLIPDPGRASYGRGGRCGLGEAYVYGDVKGCYEHFLGAPYVIVLPEPKEAAIVGAILVGLTQGKFTSLTAVSETIVKAPFKITGRRAKAIIDCVRHYAQHLGVQE